MLRPDSPLLFLRGERDATLLGAVQYGMPGLDRHVKCEEGCKAMQRLRGGEGPKSPMRLNQHGAYDFADGSSRKLPSPIPLPPQTFFEVCNGKLASSGRIPFSCKASCLCRRTLMTDLKCCCCKHANRGCGVSIWVFRHVSQQKSHLCSPRRNSVS